MLEPPPLPTPPLDGVAYSTILLRFFFSTFKNQKFIGYSFAFFRSCSVDIGNLKTPIPKSTPLPLKEPPVAPKPTQSRGKEIKASDPKAPKPCTRQLRERPGESGKEAIKEKVESNAETWRIDYIRVETEEKKPKKKKSKSGKKKVKASEVPLTVKDEYPRKLTIALASSKPSKADTKAGHIYLKMIILKLGQDFLALRAPFLLNN